MRAQIVIEENGYSVLDRDGDLFRFFALVEDALAAAALLNCGVESAGVRTPAYHLTTEAAPIELHPQYVCTFCRRAIAYIGPCGKCREAGVRP